MIYIGVQVTLLPQSQVFTDAYLDQIQAGDWEAAQQMHATPTGFQQAQAAWRALLLEMGALKGWSVHSLDMLYGISFSLQGIGGTSVTAVYILELESDSARVTLDLQPSWQSWQISKIEIQY